MIFRDIGRVVRRNLSASNALAVLALLFAMTGGAWAAKHYIITSKSQISPKVLSALKGARGASGATGPAGAAGPQGPGGAASIGKEGPQGKEGLAGKEGVPGKNGENGAPGQTGFTSALPSGKTETGTWIAQSDDIVGSREVKAAISFPIPVVLKQGETPKAVYVDVEEAGTPKEGCEGSVETPTAPAGTLCIYAQTEGNIDVTNVGIVSFNGGAGFGRPGAFIAFFSSGGTAEEPGRVKSLGAWAVTAP